MPETFDAQESARIGANIRAARQRRGWDAAELARRIRANGDAASHSSVQKLERGWMRVHTEWLRKIAAALDVRPADLRRRPTATGTEPAIPLLTWPEIVAGRPGPAQDGEPVVCIDPAGEAVAVHARERDRLDAPVNVRPGDLLILVPGGRARSDLLVVAGADGVPRLVPGPARDPVIAAVVEVRKRVPAPTGDDA